MVITFDILCPERNESATSEPKAHTDEKERSMDRTRVTRWIPHPRLQIININGEYVDA